MNNEYFLPYLFSVLTSISMMLLFFYVYAGNDYSSEFLGDVEIDKRTKRVDSRGILLKIFYPLITALSGLMSLIPMDKSREKLDLKLSQAGRPGGLNPDQFNATRIIAILFGFGAGMFIDDTIGTTPTICIGLSLLGFIYPNIWLNGIIQMRRRRIFRDLPDLLDLLRLSIDAGLDLTSAMKVVVERGRRGPLLEELELVERDISLGRTRQNSFRKFADRLAMTEINSFVVALIQADQLGASIGPILKVQAEMARTRRWQMAETLVNKMPMKMLGPLVVFIFPSSFIILFTPLLIQWMQAK